MDALPSGLGVGTVTGLATGTASWTSWWAERPAPHEEAWQDFTAAVAWLLGLQLLDLLTTLGALAMGAGEANPMAAAFLAGHGPAGLVQLKVVAVLFSLGWLPAFTWTQSATPASWQVRSILALMVLQVLFYSAVVVNNLAVLSVTMP